jgi:hypothetical protein
VAWKTWMFRGGTLVTLFLLPSIPICLVPHDLRWPLWLSFFIGQSAIPYWGQRGASAWGAIAIATACGTYDLLFSFCLFHWLRKIYMDKLKGVHQEFDRWTARSQFAWLRRTRGIGERVYYFFVPRQSRVYIGAPNPSAKDYRFYLPLLYYGVMPGGIWTGIGYMMEFNLNPTMGFLAEAAANGLKMVIFGFVSLYCVERFDWLAHRLWIFVIAAVALPFLKGVVEKQLAKVVAATQPEDA